VPRPGRPESSDGHSIELVKEADLPDLLPLMRAYCEFYEAAPADAQLLTLARALLADPEHEGLQLIARDAKGRAVGFATVFWSWSTTAAGRIGVMNDLYIVPSARGRGLADRLIEVCAERCALRGAASLEWQTAPSNLRAQAVYDRVGGKREAWLNYTLEVSPERRAGGEGWVD
jgi:GNAT superfamily N-acetyltransferase